MRDLISICENMLNEIDLIGDFDDSLNQFRFDNRYQNESKKAKRLGKLPNGFPVLTDGNELFYITDQNGTLAARLRLDEKSPNRYCVGHVWLKPEYRGKGIGFQLYVFLIDDLGITLVSDWAHTRFAKSLWEKLAKAGYVHEYYFGDHGWVIGDPIVDTRDYYTDHTDDSEPGSKSEILMVATKREIT